MPSGISGVTAGIRHLPNGESYAKDEALVERRVGGRSCSWHRRSGSGGGTTLSETPCPVYAAGQGDYLQCHTSQSSVPTTRRSDRIAGGNGNRRNQRHYRREFQVHVHVGP